MSTREVCLERLLGSKIRDRHGKTVGRVEEIEAEAEGEDLVVAAYVTGPAGALDRLASLELGLWLITVFGGAKSPKGYRISWEQLDVRDPRRPRLTCARSELRAMT